MLGHLVSLVFVFVLALKLKSVMLHNQALSTHISHKQLEKSSICRLTRNHGNLKRTKG